MNNCPETIYADGITYVCHNSPGHPDAHWDNVVEASWRDGDDAPTRRGQ